MTKIRKGGIKIPLIPIITHKFLHKIPANAKTCIMKIKADINKISLYL